MPQNKAANKGKRAAVVIHPPGRVEKDGPMEPPGNTVLLA